MNKIFAIMVTFVLLLTSCAGPQAVDMSSPSSGGAKESEALQQGSEIPVTPATNDKQVTLKIWGWINGEVLSQIQTYNENKAVQYAEEKLGIKVEYQHPVVGQEAEQMALMIASRDLPDIIEDFNYKDGNDSAISDGIIQDLTEFIPQNAPDYWKAINANETVFRQAQTDEGKLHAVYCIQPEPEDNWNGLALRKDILEELQLEPPETIEEWETVLIAFKDYGITAPLSFKLDWRFYDFGAFATAFDAMPQWYQYEEEGKMKVGYGPAEDNFKQFVELFRGWYAKGLIDKDVFSRDDKSKDAMILNGEIGAFVNGYGPVNNYMDNAKNNGDDKFDLVPVKDPSLNKGENVQAAWRKDWYVKGQPTCITTACENPEEALCWLNFGFTEEGARTYNYGIEGLTYEMVNGKPEFTEFVMQNPEGLSFVNLRDAYKRHLAAYLRDWKAFPANDLDFKCMGEWSKAKNDKAMPPFTRNVEEGRIFGQYDADLRAYRDEMLIKFITGELGMDQYETYQETLWELHLKDLIDANQSALDRYYAR